MHFECGRDGKGDYEQNCGVLKEYPQLALRAERAVYKRREDGKRVGARGRHRDDGADYDGKHYRRKPDCNVSFAADRAAL